MWTLLVFFFLTFQTGSSESSCEVVISPQQSVVKFGDPLTAICNASGSEIEGMGWESTKNGTEFTEGISSLPLKIDKVDVWKIDPMCYANTPDDQCTTVLEVTVYKTPDSVSVSESLDEIGVMREGQPYEIACSILNVAPIRYLSVIWYIGSVSVYEEHFNRSDERPINVSSVLKMTANGSHDGSEIWCTAKLNLQTEGGPPSRESVQHRLTVLYTPVCSEPANETLEIPARGNVTLNCSAKGNPKPSYSWHYPQNMPSTAINGDHSIQTLSFAVPGVYTCTASNSQGTTVKYFTLVEAERDRTTFLVLLGVFLTLGVLIIVGGALFLTSSGRFSFKNCPPGSSSVI
ncbi:cell adhesion molecule 3 isoform X1 [Oryzias melastigma]|uniref:Cell adhesion molecule 3-like n=1 Tax=Oryzias melastigma TaxID=30732 RepID=A0A3B3B4I5_ORYME|nr:cell adhesion molecule 3 isoform X1 [Oryzias melastigma]